MQTKTWYTSKDLVAAVVIVLLFIGAAYLSHTHGDTLRSLMGDGVEGQVYYAVIAFLATVLAPLTATPLIPVAVELWGPIPAALLSIFGWGVGAVVAFWIAQRFGYRLIKANAKMHELQDYVNDLPSNNLFVAVVLLRMLVPVDMLSYALGLFTSMSLTSYTLATFIGISPFAFVFAYSATIPLYAQLLVLIAVGIVLYVGHRHMRHRLRTSRAQK